MLAEKRACLLLNSCEFLKCTEETIENRDQEFCPSPSTANAQVSKLPVSLLKRWMAVALSLPSASSQVKQVNPGGGSA